jgi:Asp-tRNA(Asn)/Glu-tRNA(Gln) amidotransferase A subunit family amidase
MPAAIKDNRPAQGLRLTCGCALMAENECDCDHNVTRRLKDARFVIVGTTTLPEYGIPPVSEARIFGPTRNPWDLARTPGGSLGRGGGGRRQRHAAGRPRQRRRRLGPHPGRLLPPRGAEPSPGPIRPVAHGLPRALQRAALVSPGRASAADRDTGHGGAGTDVDVHPLGPVHAVHSVFNAAGQPAISLPLFEGADGPPLAVQIVGRPAGEGALIALAA